MKVKERQVYLKFSIFFTTTLPPFINLFFFPALSFKPCAIYKSNTYNLQNLTLFRFVKTLVSN